MGEQDSKINKLFLSGVGWMGISKTISQVGTWVATILIARMLSPGDYGLVGMSGLLVGIITLVGDFGLNSSIIRKESVTHRELSALSWQFVLLGSFFFCLIYLLAPLGCSFWNEPDLLNLIRLSALSFFLTSLGQVPSALMQKKMRFKEYGFALSLSAIVGSGVTIILAYFGYGPYSLIFGTICVLRSVVVVDPPQAEMVAAKLRQLGARLTKEKITADELERALEPTLTSIRDIVRTNRYWMHSVLVQSTRHPERLEWPKTIQSDIAAITVDEVSALGAKYLKPEKAAEVILLPSKKE